MWRHWVSVEIAQSKGLGFAIGLYKFPLTCFHHTSMGLLLAKGLYMYGDDLSLLCTQSQAICLRYKVVMLWEFTRAVEHIVMQRSLNELVESLWQAMMICARFDLSVTSSHIQTDANYTCRLTPRLQWTIIVYYYYYYCYNIIPRTQIFTAATMRSYDRWIQIAISRQFSLSICRFFHQTSRWRKTGNGTTTTKEKQLLWGTWSLRV